MAPRRGGGSAGARARPPYEAPEGPAARAENIADTPDKRVSELERFDFVSAPLRQVNTKLVTTARATLSRDLNKAYGESVKAWLVRQKEACQADFLKQLEHLESRAAGLAAFIGICAEFEEVTAFVGGSVAGALKSGMHRKLWRKLSKKFPEVLSASSDLREGELLLESEEDRSD